MNFTRALVSVLGAITALAVATPVEAASGLSGGPPNGCLTWIYADCVEPFPYQSGLDRIDQRTFPLDERYVYNYTGAGVNVYVVDDGVNAADPEFGGRAT